MSDPLICCICPAHKEEFIARAVRCLVRQMSPDRYLLLLNTSQNLYISTGGIRVSELFQLHKPEWNRRTVGSLRNELIKWSMDLLCTSKTGVIVQAPDPDYIAHFDWDDVSAPDRLSRQLAHIQETGKLVTGFYDMPMYDAKNDKVWIYTHADNHFALGTSLFYKREAWERVKFPDKTPEDNQWRRDVGYDNCESQSVFREDGTPMMVQVVHGGNASARIVPSSRKFKEASEAQEKAVRELLASVASGS